MGYTLIGPEYDMNTVFDALSFEELRALLFKMERDGIIERFTDRYGVEQWRLKDA